MASSRPTSGRKRLDPESALQELLALPLGDRLDAIARDVRRRTPRYREIPAHALAEAVGIPDSWSPGGDWSFTQYAEIRRVEEHARYNSPASELVYLIEDQVDAQRFQRLLEFSEGLDDVEAPSFSFLSKLEREALERAIAERQLEANASNGLCCIGRYSIKAPCGDVLEFEGDIEDDGACIDLRTPYDKLAERFRDLQGCLTTDW